MGHIKLAAPVAHIWMSKELPSPSKISLVLDIPYKDAEEVIYFVNYIILDNAGSKVFNNRDVVDLTNARTNKLNRGKLRKILSDIKDKVAKDSIDYKRATDYYDRLKDAALPFTIEEVFSFIKKHTNIRFGIGAEAIYELLKGVDLQKESVSIQNELSKLDPSNARFRKLMRRLEVIR
jgi:DNA-directed RNA polymerase subunit beta'